MTTGLSNSGSPPVEILSGNWFASWQLELTKMLFLKVSIA